MTDDLMTPNDGYEGCVPCCWVGGILSAAEDGGAFHDEQPVLDFDLLTLQVGAIAEGDFEKSEVYRWMFKSVDVVDSFLMGQMLSSPR